LKIPGLEPVRARFAFGRWKSPHARYNGIRRGAGKKKKVFLLRASARIKNQLILKLSKEEIQEAERRPKEFVPRSMTKQDIRGQQVRDIALDGI
jgi:hypothetical protein